MRPSPIPILSQARIYPPLQPLGAAFGLTRLPKKAKTHSPLGAEGLAQEAHQLQGLP